MFQKSFELCDVVSLLLVQDNGQVLLTGNVTPPGSVSLTKTAANLYRLPSLKVVNEEWTQTASDLMLCVLGKANKMRLFKLYKVWVPLHAQKYIHHVVYLVNVQKDAKKKSRGNAFKVDGKVYFQQNKYLFLASVCLVDVVRRNSGCQGCGYACEP